MEQPTTDSTPEQRLAALFQAPAEVSEEPVEQVETQADEPQAEQAEEVAEAAPEDDGEDFEIDGEVYKLPPNLKAKVSEWKEGSLRQADYTRKTQELAALQKQVSAVAEAADMRQKFDQAISGEKEQLTRLKSQLESFKSLDWNTIDADVAQKLFYQREQLKEQAAELEKTIQGKYSQFNEWSQQQRRKVLQEAQTYLEQTIKGWGPEAVKEVTSAAKSVGYGDHELESVIDPRFIRLAHKAAQWDKLQSGKEAAVSSAKKAPPVVKPGVGQGQKAATENKYRDARQSLKKSGDVRDAARLFMLRG